MPTHKMGIGKPTHSEHQMRHLMLAHWDSQTVDRYDDTLSTKLSLRLVNKADKYDTDNTTRACNDLCMYVFYSRKTEIGRAHV